MTQTCDNGECTGPLGHEGPHGSYEVPGLILAPRTNVGAQTDERAVALPCDSCGLPLRATLYEKGGRLDCSCDQSHEFTEDGEHTQTKITLFPSIPPHDMPPSLRREFIDHWRGKQVFVLQARQVLGLTPMGTIEEVDNTIADFWAKDEAMHRPWWRTLLRR